MALLLIEGFEQYTLTDESELARGGWYTTTGAWTTVFNFVTGRHTGGRAVTLQGNGFNLTHAVKPSASFTCGFAYKLLNGGPANLPLLACRNNAIDHLVLVATAAGELELRRGVTQIDITSGLGLTQGVWYYFEIEATIDNSVGAYDVHMDGSQLFADTSVDTQNAGAAQCDNIEFHGNSTLDPIVDDIYFLDDTGADNTGLLGDCRVETIYPDADGNENDFTRVGGGSNNYEAVDDGGSPDDDSTYNWSATVTDRELYGFAALAGSIDTIYGVDAKMLVRKEDAGFREVRVIGRSNVTEVESVDKTLGVDYRLLNHIYENDPNGGIDWTESAVNSAQFGLDLQT